MRSLCISLLVLGLAGNCVRAQQEEAPPNSRMTTYEKATGEIFFALSLRPNEPVASATNADVVVLIDTSASQVGLFREDSLLCLERLLDGLLAEDRVRLFALDLKAEPLHENWSGADSEPIRAAISKLRARAPLGSTDMLGGLRTAMSCFDSESSAARRIIYIGDGVSRASFINVGELKVVLHSFKQMQVTVSSFAIGRQRNVELLAALANHSGGTVLLDAEGSDVAVQAGSALAKDVRAGVLWPVKIEPNEALLAVFPIAFPPLRSDRDSIIIGLLKNRDPQTWSGEFRGLSQQVAMRWEITPEPSSGEFGFLPKLVEMAAKDGGARLPTAGSAALREVGRLIQKDARGLLQLGNQALKQGDFKAALGAANSVLERDPENPEAMTLKQAAERGWKKQLDAAKKTQDSTKKSDKPSGLLEDPAKK